MDKDKMKKPTEEDDFNWVEARQNCSVATAFEALKKTAETNVEERKKHLDKDAGARLIFEDNSRSQFSVTRAAPSGDKGVLFHLRENLIFVLNVGGNNKSTLTPFLNDDGECRFAIDGEGEFLPWQVAQKALENILF